MRKKIYIKIASTIKILTLTIGLLFLNNLSSQVKDKVTKDYGKSIWETPIKELTGKESYVLKSSSQDCAIGRAYETLVNENNDTLFCTHYAIAFEGKVYAQVHIFNNKQTGKIEVIFYQRNASILDDVSGTHDINANDFKGLTYEIKGVVNTLTNGKKELALKYLSSKKQHLNCLEIMDFNLTNDRLHYKINN
jgi:hypothetical protein